MEFSRRRRHKTEEKFSVFNLCFGFGTVPMVIRRYQQTISLSTSRRLRKRNDEEAWRRSAGDDVEFDTQNSRRHVTMKASSGEAGMSYGFLWLFAACVNLYTKLSKRRTRKKFINDRSWKKCRCFDRMIIIYSSFFLLADDVAPNWMRTQRVVSLTGISVWWNLTGFFSEDVCADFAQFLWR